MFEFLKIDPESFGLDFSDLSLRLIKLTKKRKNFSLDSWGELELEPGIIENGEIKKEDVLIQKIRELITNVNGRKIKTRNVIASLPERKAFFQVIKMPKMNKEELKNAVLFEAENYIPLPVKDVYIDFQIIPRLKNKKIQSEADAKVENILLAAFPKKEADSYFFCLEKSGLKPRALEVESQSIVRALIKNETSYYPLLIVDFGKSNTSFILFYGHSIYSTSSILVSSNDITIGISKLLKIKLEEAEKLKIKYGILKEGKKNKKEKIDEEKKQAVIEAAKGVLKVLAQEIKKRLEYYQTHIDFGPDAPSKKKIKKIILCGKGANLKGIVEFLSLTLKIPVEIGNPWINIFTENTKNLPVISYEESLGYTTAIGLSLRDIKEQENKND